MTDPRRCSKCVSDVVPKPIYSWEEMREKSEILKRYGLILSNQHGMLFLLDEEGWIVLRLDPLVSEEERSRYG